MSRAVQRHGATARFENASNRAVSKAVNDVKRSGYKKIDVNSKMERRTRQPGGFLEFDLFSGLSLKFDSGYTERKMNANVEGTERRGNSVVKRGSNTGVRRVDMNMEHRTPQQIVEISLPTLLGLKPMVKNYQSCQRGQVNYRK